ncbi:MAG TPA: hypothetical protein VJ801_16345 [Polyangia bacterium]|jgi:hypothetical protein|nr:hypothetical protein [Polyangia bacterium]
MFDEAPEVLIRVEQLGLEGGFLPEFVPGPSKRQPLAVNPRHYLFVAACAKERWSMHSLVMQEQFDKTIAAVDDGAVR